MVGTSIATLPPRQFPLPDAYQRFIQGLQATGRSTPADIAWSLESDAVRHGWVVGRFIGSQTELMKRFGVNREAMREAIRILEARGSMLMQRGRKGGLRLAEPDLDWAAAAFVMCLRGSGFDAKALHETIQVAAPVMNELPPDHLITRFYRRTLDLLEMNGAASRCVRLRSMWIATHILQCHTPVPSDGVALGREEDLCEQFGSSRSTYRQALRILADLGMLRLRRGRGGGYMLKRATPIGVVRQMFALLACQQQTLADLLPIKLLLDITNVRLALRALERLESAERAAQCDALEFLLADATEPHRWCVFQQAIGAIANNLMINTLIWGVVVYALRVDSCGGLWEEIDSELYELQRGIVQAMRNGYAHQAEHLYHCAQKLVSQQLHDRSTWQ